LVAIVKKRLALLAEWAFSRKGWRWEPV